MRGLRVSAPGPCAVAHRASGDEANLPLMSQGQHADLVACHHEPVQSDVTGLPIGDHELSNIAVHTATEERVGTQMVYGGSNRRDGFNGCR